MWIHLWTNLCIYLLNKACILWFILLTQTFRTEGSETFACTGVFTTKSFWEQKILVLILPGPGAVRVAEDLLLKVVLPSTRATALNIPVRSSTTHSIYQYLTLDLNHLAFANFFLSVLFLAYFDQIITCVPTMQIFWWESVTDHSTRMKRQIKYSVSSRQLGEVSPSLALILMGNFYLPDAC